MVRGTGWYVVPPISFLQRWELVPWRAQSSGRGRRLARLRQIFHRVFEGV